MHSTTTNIGVSLCFAASLHIPLHMMWFRRKGARAKKAEDPSTRTTESDVTRPPSPVKGFAQAFIEKIATIAYPSIPEQNSNGSLEQHWFDAMIEGSRDNSIYNYSTESYEQEASPITVNSFASEFLPISPSEHVSKSLDDDATPDDYSLRTISKEQDSISLAELASDDWISKDETNEDIVDDPSLEVIYDPTVEELGHTTRENNTDHGSIASGGPGSHCSLSADDNESSDTKLDTNEKTVKKRFGFLKRCIILKKKSKKDQDTDEIESQEREKTSHGDEIVTSASEQVEFIASASHVSAVSVFLKMCTILKKKSKKYQDTNEIEGQEREKTSHGDEIVTSASEQIELIASASHINAVSVQPSIEGGNAFSQEDETLPQDNDETVEVKLASEEDDKQQDAPTEVDEPEVEEATEDTEKCVTTVIEAKDETTPVTDLPPSSDLVENQKVIEVGSGGNDDNDDGDDDDDDEGNQSLSPVGSATKTDHSKASSPKVIFWKRKKVDDNGNGSLSTIVSKTKPTNNETFWKRKKRSADNLEKEQVKDEATVTTWASETTEEFTNRICMAQHIITVETVSQTKSRKNWRKKLGFWKKEKSVIDEVTVASDDDERSTQKQTTTEQDSMFTDIFFGNWCVCDKNVTCQDTTCAADDESVF